jgi:hypothetical protein
MRNNKAFGEWTHKSENEKTTGSFDKLERKTGLWINEWSGNMMRYYDGYVYHDVAINEYRSEYNYKDGRLNGMERTYKEGVLVHQSNYKHDELHGYAVVYGIDGFIVNILYYIAGEIVYNNEYSEDNQPQDPYDNIE